MSEVLECQKPYQIGKKWSKGAKITYVIPRSQIPSRLESNTRAVVLDQVEDAAICNSRTRAGTQVFLGVKGATSKKIYLVGNELHEAGKPFTVDAKVKEGTVNAVNNF
jgi:hypothetical protein